MQRASGEVERLIGQGPPFVMPPRATNHATFDVEDFVRRSMYEIWNWRLFGKIPEYFAVNYLCHTASDRELYGVGDYTQDVLARIAAFPDASMEIDDLYWNDDGGGRYRVAVLWTMLGTHTGPSIYGPPTGPARAGHGHHALPRRARKVHAGMDRVRRIQPDEAAIHRP